MQHLSQESTSSIICSLFVPIVYFLFKTCKIVFEKNGLFSQWVEMRSLLNSAGYQKTKQSIATHTFFYDLSLEYVISVRGFLFLFSFVYCNEVRQSLRSVYSFENKINKATETNHSLKMYYFQPYAPKECRFRNPTKWCYSVLESRPFWDQKSVPDAQILEEHASKIISEYQGLASRSLVLHPDQRTEVESGKWQWLHLYGVGGRQPGNCRIVPQTAAVVDSLNICKPFGFVFFSKIAPKTHIVPHTGSSNLRIRLHLGVDIPKFEWGNSGEKFSSCIRVGKESRTWSQGKTMVFDDSFEHGVNYTSDNPRSVLIADIWHPDLTEDEIAIFSAPIFGKFGRHPSSGFKRVKD